MLQSVVRRAKAGWESLGIDFKMFCLMFKGSVPVAISLAFYQSTPVSEVYSSLGFLVAIIAVVTVNLLPRAKLIEMTFTISLFTAIAIPVTMLSTWSGLQARYHTDPNGLNHYNSSQSAVTAVWLFFNIVLSNSLQARYSTLLIPTILYNIFVIVQYTSCSRFTTWKQCWGLIYLTTKCYYTGVAISFFSGIIIYPVTCRTEFFEVTENYFNSLHGMLDETVGYLRQLQSKSDTSASVRNSSYTEAERLSVKFDGTTLKKKSAEVKALYVKVHQELIMAKREFAWGKLRARDLTSISDLCRKILMPMGGIAHLPDIFERIAEGGGWTPCDFDDVKSPHPPGPDVQELYEKVWHSSLSALVEPVQELVETMNQGLKHVALKLELAPVKTTCPRFSRSSVAPKPVSDAEADAGRTKPGDIGFSKFFETQLDDFFNRRDEALNAWASSQGISEAQLRKMQKLNDSDEGEDNTGKYIPRDRQQLYVILYMQHMIYTAGKAILELSRFSDEMVATGVMAKSHLIVPSARRLYSWFLSIWDTSEATLADDERPSSREEKKLLHSISNRTTRNIEHLPPSNAYERFGVRINRFQEFLKGPELSFGFRSACATMSCAIVAYLHSTQEIFTHYRLIWSVIISAIGANMSAGQSGVSYALRILGSFAALIICYGVWYIPNGNVAGVIVVMWLASFFQMYFLLRWPKYIIGWLVILITEVLSIGYELQVRKIGVAAAESTGTYVFPPYYVAAMRVACVLWGTCASIFFTYLPYPITARSLLRKDMAIVMQLLANYHAVVHSTIKARLLGAEGDVADISSPGRILAHTRKAIFNKIMVLSSAINHNVYLQKYEPGLGGRFPVAMFQDIMSQLTVLLDLISLLSYATQVWAASEDPRINEIAHSSKSRAWLNDLSKLIETINPIEKQITSVLWQLSAAVSTGQPLLPGTGHSSPYLLSDRLRTLDPEILHMTHMFELEYSAHAVMEIISSMITYKIKVLVATIESLVGVVDFEFVETDTNGKGKHE